MITKNTKIGISIGTLGGALAFLWVAIGTVQGAMEQVQVNTKSIKQLYVSVELGRIDRQIGDLQREERSLKRHLRNEPTNDLLLEQLDEVKHKLDNLNKLKECVVDPAKEVCK